MQPSYIQPAVATTTIVTQQPSVQSWGSGICACFDDMKSCKSPIILFCFIGQAYRLFQKIITLLEEREKIFLFILGLL